LGVVALLTGELTAGGGEEAPGNGTVSLVVTSGIVEAASLEAKALSLASTEGGAHSSVRVDGAVTSEAIVPLTLVVGAAVVGGIGHVAHNLAGVGGGVPHALVILVTGLLEGVAVGALGEAVTTAGCADGGLEALSGGYILGAGHIAQ
jgi:hypothetical protein